MEMLLRNQQDKVVITPEMEELFYNVVKLVIEEEKTDIDPEVSVLLVDDQEIQSLNKAYRGINHPTDVLSFAMEDEMEGVPEFVILEDNNVLGDIVISMETAMRQAEEYGHTLEREIGFLAVHGMLHLFGYDHSTHEESVQMRIKEETVLSRLNLIR